MAVGEDRDDIPLFVAPIADDPLEFIQKRLSERGCQLVAQYVNFTESSAQYVVLV